MEIKLPENKIKTPIRHINFEKLHIGGDCSFPFMSENNNKTKPLIALELLFFYDENFPDVLKQQYGENYEIISAVKKFENIPNDLLSIKFNLTEENFNEKIKIVKSKIKEIFNSTKKTLILRGVNNKELDKKLLPILAKEAPKQCIIAFIEEMTYEDILPSLIENNHIVIIRTPIDINLAKEMNILTTDKGLDINKIIIDPDMGGLGYGLDYGYSIIEKTKQVALDGDTMLNMPIIGFIGEESFKAKEAKSDCYDKNWGEYEKRAIMWEIAGASSIVAAGANIVVVWHSQTVKTLKEVLKWN